ncbi:MAG: LytR family transcriptional regulator, partial [Firmicutes bacterium HGW-Firmicutes-6]
MKKKIILVILFLIVSLIGTGLVYGFNTISQINQMVAEPKMDEADLKVNNDLDIDTINIAVFGVDGRSDIEGDRTDTIMIVSMDFRNGNIKVTSVMRDLLVQIPETKDTYESLDKINAAYAYGGP